MLGFFRCIRKHVGGGLAKVSDCIWSRWFGDTLNSSRECWPRKTLKLWYFPFLPGVQGLHILWHRKSKDLNDLSWGDIYPSFQFRKVKFLGAPNFERTEIPSFPRLYFYKQLSVMNRFCNTLSWFFYHYCLSKKGKEKNLFLDVPSQMSSLCMFNVQKSLKVYDLLLTQSSLVESALKFSVLASKGQYQNNNKKMKSRCDCICWNSSPGTSHNLKNCWTTGRPQGQTSWQAELFKASDLYSPFLCFFKKKNSKYESLCITKHLIAKRSLFFFPGLCLLECVWVCALCNSFQ